MAILAWDETGKKLYSTGVDRGVFWKQKPTGEYESGVAWSGLISVSESPEGAEEESFWADNIKYLSLRSAEELGFGITAYSSPEEFDECDGAKELAPGVTIRQQNRAGFAFSYRSLIGNDTAKNDYGYKIHIYYGCSASPSDVEHNTVNDSPEAEELSWDCTTLPVNVPGYKPTATVEIDSTKIDAEKLRQIEDKLYGTAEEESTLLMPSDIIEILGTSSTEVSG